MVHVVFIEFMQVDRRQFEDTDPVCRACYSVACLRVIREFRAQAVVEGSNLEILREKMVAKIFRLVFVSGEEFGIFQERKVVRDDVRIAGGQCIDRLCRYAQRIIQLFHIRLLDGLHDGAVIIAADFAEGESGDAADQRRCEHDAHDQYDDQVLLQLFHRLSFPLSPALRSSSWLLASSRAC